MHQIEYERRRASIAGDRLDLFSSGYCMLLSRKENFARCRKVIDTQQLPDIFFEEGVCVFCIVILGVHTKKVGCPSASH